MLCRVPLLVVALAGFSAAQTFQVTSVVNAARGDSRISPGALARVNGSNFPFTNLGVRIGERNVPVVGSVSPTQFNIQLPFDLPLGTADLIVIASGPTSNPFPVTVDDYAPGIFLSLQQEGAFQRENQTAVSAANPAAPGEPVKMLATGLGAVNPPFPAGSAPPDATNLTVVPPRVLVSGKLATVRSAALAPAQAGAYEVVFVVPPDINQGENPVVIEIGGKTSNTAVLFTSGGPPVVSAVVNGATFRAGPVAPGSFVSVFANNLGTRNFIGAFPRTNLEDITVFFNNIPIPISDVIATANQINVIVPQDFPEGAVNVTVSNPRGRSQPFTAQVVRTDPGIFLVSDPSNPDRRNAAALLANTAWYVMPLTMARAYNLPGCTVATSVCGQPVRAGDVIQLYVTGLGRATPGGDPGGRVLRGDELAPAGGNPLFQTVERPMVTIGGAAANVVFSGIAPGFAGLYQLNVVVPGVPPGDDVAVRVEMPGGASSTATIAIRN